MHTEIVFQMADQKEEILKDDDFLTKADIWIKNNKKSLTIIGVAVAVIVGGFLAYKFLYVNKRENSAATQLYEHAFFAYEKDSLNIAADGDPLGQGRGLVKMVNDYGSTQAGKIGRYLLGMIYLKKGSENPEFFQQAINQLSSVDFGDDEYMLTTQAWGCMGDAYVELGDLENGVSQYEKAADRHDNYLLSPYYLRKAATVHEELGNWDRALKHYKRIQEDYPDSQQALDLERYISRAENSK